MSQKILDYECWLVGSPLGQFLSRLDELRPQALKETKREVLVLTRFRVCIWEITAFSRYLGWILERLSDDFSKFLEPDLTPSHGKTVEFWATIYPVNLDFISFILFARILMDKISSLLHMIVVGEDKPSEISFYDWRKRVGDYEGEGLEELKKIINDADWFDELKDVRDDYIVHHGMLLSPSIGIVGEQIELRFYSHTRKRDVAFTIKKIQKLSDDIHQFLEDLTGFLCDNLDLLPITILKGR